MLNILKASSSMLAATSAISKLTTASIVPSVSSLHFRRLISSGVKLHTSSSSSNSSGNGDQPSSTSTQRTEDERKLADMLRARFPTAKQIQVNDISGGCGAMYEIFVESDEFKNVRKVKQHQMISQVLESEIRNKMHGVRIYTAVPESST